MDLCKQNFIKAVDEIPLGLRGDFGPSHMIEQSVDAAYLIITKHQQHSSTAGDIEAQLHWSRIGSIRGAEQGRSKAREETEGDYGIQSGCTE